MLLRLLITLLFAAATAQSTNSSKPHLIFVLTDDNGWAGVGYNNPYVNTPHLDALAADGLKLTSQYVYKYCAPTRGSFLTGRFPYKLAATRANLIPWTLPDGTHLGYSMLPNKLKAAGYTSVHIGKWHQGLYTPSYTPVGRGFDQSYGFLEGGEDHNTSRTFGNWCKLNEVDLSRNQAQSQQPFPYKWPACTWQEQPSLALQSAYTADSVDILNYNPFLARKFDTVDGCRALCQNRVDCAGFSWRNADPAHQFYHNCFLVSKVGANPTQNPAFTSASCARDRTETTIPAVGDNGTYTGQLFSAEAVKVVESHDTTTPLFLYLALHNTHAPLEAPWDFVKQYNHLNDSKRASFSGMLSYVDETVGNLTGALKARGMWENTLFVWTNDNGSPVSAGGSNHPLRGGKGSNWEGGTRVPTFVNGGLLPAGQRGRSHDGMIHIADWHATLLKMAGLDPSVGEPHAVSELDGIDVWPWVSGQQAGSDRKEIVYDHRMFQDVNASSVPPAGCVNASGRCITGALRVGDWKLVVGPEAQNSWFGWFSPNVSDPGIAHSPEYLNQSCLHPNPCLFDLTDMTEHDDVAAQNPHVVSALMARFMELSKCYHPPQNNPAVDLAGYCAAIVRNQGFVGPWQQLPTSDVGL